MKTIRGSRLYLLLCAGALVLCLAALCVGLCLGGGEGTGNVPGSGVSYESVSPPDVDLDGVVEGLGTGEWDYDGHCADTKYERRCYEIPLAVMSEIVPRDKLIDWIKKNEKPTVMDFFKDFEITQAQYIKALEKKGVRYSAGQFSDAEAQVLASGSQTVIDQTFVAPQAFFLNDTIYTLGWVLEADGAALSNAGFTTALMEGRAPFFGKQCPQHYDGYLAAIERLRDAGGGVDSGRRPEPAYLEDEHGPLWYNDKVCGIPGWLFTGERGRELEKKVEVWAEGFGADCFSGKRHPEEAGLYLYIRELGITREEFERADTEDEFADWEVDVLFCGDRSLFDQTYVRETSVYAGPIYSCLFFEQAPAKELYGTGVRSWMLENRKDFLESDYYGNPSDWNPIIKELKRLEREG